MQFGTAMGNLDEAGTESPLLLQHANSHCKFMAIEPSHQHLRPQTSRQVVNVRWSTLLAQYVLAGQTEAVCAATLQT